jgi:alanine racemase
MSIETFRNRPTRALISLANLATNFAIAKSLVGPTVNLMGVVKANAYGHGILEVSQALLALGAHSLGVAFLEEGIFLRQNGITAPILVLGAINADQIPDFLHHDIAITSSSLDKSRSISSMAVAMGKTARVHLKIDTGMERIGVHWYNADAFIDQTLALPGIVVEGIFSHLAKADTDRDFTQEQIARFSTIVDRLAKAGTLPRLVHLANSEGVIHYPSSHFNLVRPGIMLYGYATQKAFGEHTLRPVMSLLTKVAFFKVVPEGAGISYNHTARTTRQTRVVTLPIGYGDGYNRLLSNRGEVVIRGQRHRVAGNVCMDQTMVDLGPDGTAYNGDDVLLFGEYDGHTVALESLCAGIGTIPYEVLCMIADRVPRIYRDR